ncbi:MAG: TRAP transporter small permease [Deltaproteobacteria bacterium]|nr:TRAP transporter small permease [Deltaproteobacteria bacterium]
MHRLSRLSNILENICRSAAGILMLAMAALVFAEVINRYLFSSSYEFVPVISSWFMVWMTYFMLGAIMKTRQHISIDILPSLIPGNRLFYLLAFFDLVSIIFSLVLCYGALKYDLMVMKTNLHSISVPGIPIWIVRLSVPLGGIFLLFFSIEHLIVDVLIRSKRDGGKG